MVWDLKEVAEKEKNIAQNSNNFTYNNLNIFKAIFLYFLLSKKHACDPFKYYETRKK